MEKIDREHWVGGYDFTEILAPLPTLEKVAAEYQEFERKLEVVNESNTLIPIIQEWDFLCRRLSTWYAVIDLKFNQDTRVEKYRKDIEYRDEVWPQFTELAVQMKRKLLENPFRKEVESHFGSHIIAIWEADIMAYSPLIQQDLVSESKLKAQYIELTASAMLSFKEKIYNISEIKKFAEESDRHVRHDSQRVLWKWFEDNGHELDFIYDTLVNLRTGMAKKLGFNDFIGLAYKQMKRIDYHQVDVENYREEVLKHVVPLTKMIREKQRLKLGLDKLYSYDQDLFEPSGNPKPKGDHDWLLERGIDMFDTLGGGLGEFFHYMKDSHLMDLKNREGKAPGGFCTYFPTAGVPFIYANFNGTMGDVDVFTHELGHAFQSYSSRNLPLLDYQNPSYDSCEIHSMSLEFLTSPQMDKFFDKEGAEQFSKIQLAEALLFLPYGVAIDHFQHLVYARPEASPSERHAMWLEMEKMYLPVLNWHDLSYPAKGGRWQLTPHLYLNPFYYIDYTLAQCCALQFWHLSQQDFVDAMNKFQALCKRGGEAPFQELIRGCGLKSHFQKGCLEEIANRAYEVLDLGE